MLKKNKTRPHAHGKGAAKGMEAKIKKQRKFKSRKRKWECVSHLLRDTGVPRDAGVRLTDSRARLGMGRERRDKGRTVQ